MKTTASILCALLLLSAGGCEKNDGGGKTDQDFTVTETMRQKRSSKRGISGNLQLPEYDFKLVSPGLGWFYTWGNSCPANVTLEQMEEYDVTFFPMIWNNNYSLSEIQRYKSAYPKAQYVLAYNEPNLTDQANMTPTQAAANWGKVKADVASCGMKLISPALNYGTLPDYHDPIKWMDEFLACDGVSLDDFEAIALHCYMPNVSGLRSFVRLFDKYDKPIYMTEFCHANGAITNNAYTQETFMCDVLNYMECDPAIEGYSWFMSRADGNWSQISILTKNANNPALTDLGKVYVYFSSFDKTTYYEPGEAIPAEHYVAISTLADDVDGAMADTPRVTPSKDGDSMLDLTDFYSAGKWVEYQIEVPESRSYRFAVRYLGDITAGTYDFSIDGVSFGELSFPKNPAYATMWAEGIHIDAGKHTLRVTNVNGRTDFNWFYLE